MSEAERAGFGFDCPNCGDTTVIRDVDEPEDVLNNIYECGGCGENILLDNYRGGE